MNEKRIAARDKRRQCLKITRDTVPFALKMHVFGDYLDTTRMKPHTLKRDVMSAFAKVPQALATVQDMKIIFPNRSWGDLALEWGFESVRDTEKVWRETLLFETIIDQNHQTIYRFLFAGDRRKAFAALPQLVHVRRSIREKKHQALKLALIEKGCSEDDVQKIRVLTTRHTLEGRTVMRDFRSGALSLSNCVNELIQMLRFAESAKERKTDLIEELKTYDLSLRSDSGLCNAFLAGRHDLCKEQVAALMYGTSFLFVSGGHICWSQNHSEMDSKIRAGQKLGLTWREAVNEAIMTFDQSPLTT